VIIIRTPREIGEVLRRRRQERGHTLLGMGVRLGTRRGRVSEWEHGHRIPNAATFIRYANALGYDVALVPMAGHLTPDRRAS
jgi:transcriptional regulator with XRE-family HTH domain